MKALILNKRTGKAFMEADFESAALDSCAINQKSTLRTNGGHILTFSAISDTTCLCQTERETERKKHIGIGGIKKIGFFRFLAYLLQDKRVQKREEIRKM